MLFTDDIVLIYETRAGVNVKLELWRQALESRDFKLSKAKIEYMECKFSKHRTQDYSIVTLDGKEISINSHFRYLGFYYPKGWGDQ